MEFSRSKMKKTITTNSTSLLQEAMDFVNNLHTVRPYDSTWDEYMQYVLENS